MKKLSVLLTGLIALIGISLTATAVNEKAVEATFESINAGSAEKVKPYLDENFTIAGQQGEIAVLVLEQLIMQIDETVTSYKKTSEKNENGNTVLTYKVEYKNLGEKESVFVISPEGKLVELSLFEMRVETMEGSAEVTKSDQQIVELPFEMTGNLIALEADLNGIKRKFLLDSGSPQLILNAAHYNAYNQEEKVDGQKHVINDSRGVGGSIGGMDIVSLESFDLGGIRMNDQKVVVMDLSHLEKELGSEFYGLIGYDVIRHYDVMFDYENQKLVLIDPEAYGDFLRENKKSIRDAVNLQMIEHIPVVSVKIGKESYRMGIDCGAESSLFDIRHFEKLKSGLSGISTDSLAGADENIRVVQKANLEKMKIGYTNFKDTEVLFSDMSHFGDGLDGLIGYEIISHQRTILSFSSGQMILLD